MIPYHQLHKPSEAETAMRGDYDGQGKSAQREEEDSLTMIVLVAAWIIVTVLVALWGLTLWLE